MINKCEYLKVENESGLIRDTYNNAILSYDISQKKKFIEEQKRERMIKNAAQLNTRIENLEASVQKIESMMLSMMNIMKNQRSYNGEE